jgi:hypothetical protein
MVGPRVDREVAGLIWDFAPLRNAQHLAAHDIYPDDVEAVRSKRYLVFENLPGRGGSHVMIGRDARNRSLYISMRETAEPSIWEPVTGWRSPIAHRILREEGLI